MKLHNWLLGCGLLISGITMAQQSTLIDGRVRMLDGSIIPVVITNVSKHFNTTSDLTGYYNINASVGDTLRFNSSQSAVGIFIMTKEDIASARVNVVLSKPGQNLEEIVILTKEIGPEFFGLSDAAKLTDAQRQYRAHNTLTSATTQGNVGISLEAIGNLFNGKRKAGKQAIEMERLDLKVNDFLYVYPAGKLIENLSIDQDQVFNFLYYLVEQPSYDVTKVSMSPEYQLYLAQNYTEFLAYTSSAIK